MSTETVVEEDVVKEPEVEAVDACECSKGQKAECSKITISLTEVLEETTKLFEVFGRAIVTTTQDITNLVVVHADEDMRRRMDLLIQSDVAKNRSEAAEFLMAEGIAAKRPFFEKVERTKAQISALEEQLRSLSRASVAKGS
jgi:hypothetical protein